LPLANHKVVVTELNSYSEIDPVMKDAVLHCPYDQLVDFCVSIVNNPKLRQQYENQGYATLKKRLGTPIIGAAMENYLAGVDRPKLHTQAKPAGELPKKLRLGSGNQWSFDYLNIDADPQVRSDLTLEIGKALDFSANFESWRFGHIQLKEGHFDYISAQQVMHTVEDLTTALKNCLYLLAEDGLLEITVPYYLATEAWKNPKTKRAFNEQSFDFLKEQQFEFSGKKYQLHVDSWLYIMEEYGIKLHTEQLMGIEQLAKTPNAITCISIKLSKKQIPQESDIMHHLNQQYQTGRYRYD